MRKTSSETIKCVELDQTSVKIPIYIYIYIYI